MREKRDYTTKGVHNGVLPYRCLALYIIWQAIRDGDVEFFCSEWFETLADLLGYSPDGMRELALAKIRECLANEDSGNRPRT